MTAAFLRTAASPKADPGLTQTGYFESATAQLSQSMAFAEHRPQTGRPESPAIVQAETAEYIRALDVMAQFIDEEFARLPIVSTARWSALHPLSRNGLKDSDV